MLLTVLVGMSIPVSYIMIALGFAYSKVYGSQLTGFLVSMPIIFIGAVSGEMLAFLLSRFLFKDIIKSQIKHSEWLNKKFIIADDIIKDEGKLFVFLIKLACTPAGLFSYIMGVSCISFFDFAIGNISYLFWASSLSFIGCSMFSVVDSPSGN